jgi:hypothetical protein
MSHFSHYLSSSVKLTLAAGLVASAACAARPIAPPPAVPESEAAPATGGSGVAEQQPPATDDFVFVPKEHKETATHDDTSPATSLRADETARKQRVAR